MIRPRVLFLTCHLPFPALSGGRRRELELIKRLSKRFDLHLMVASKTIGEDSDNLGQLQALCRQVELFPVLPLPPESERGAAPLQVLRHRSPALSRRVGELLALGAADLVHVEGFYLAQHVPAGAEVPLLLVEQNVEYELWRQRWLASEAARERLDLSWQQRVTRRGEVDAWRRADLLATLTAEDRAAINGILPRAEVRLVPDGSDHLPRHGAGPAQPVTRPAGPLLVFVANFAYEPNVDAASHLCSQILPLITARVPDVRLWLVGNSPPPAVRALAGERVRVTGRVAEVVPYIDAADVIVCPLRIGGGMKVKAIEALRRGKALVSSSIGVQGFPAQARELLAIADEPAAFADLATRLLLDPAARRRSERRAARALPLLPTWDRAAEALAGTYDELLLGQQGLAARRGRVPEELSPQELAV